MGTVTRQLWTVWSDGGNEERKEKAGETACLYLRFGRMVISLVASRGGAGLKGVGFSRRDFRGSI